MVVVVMVYISWLQIVAEMVVDVHIKELRTIKNLRATEVQSANEIATEVAGKSVRSFVTCNGFT